MTKLYSKKMISSLLMLLWICFSPNSFAVDTGSRYTLALSTEVVCPEGFVRIPSGLACVATNITTTATADVEPGIDCPDGFERPPGVRFCIAENLTLEIQDNVMLIAAYTTDQCPEGFSRPVGSTICTADNLVVDVIDNEVTLVAYSGDCPKGFYRPVGSRFCVAENLTSNTLPAPAVGFCPPGFIKPPGVHFCIASELLYKDETRLNEIVPPVGLCPEGWVKPENANFCQPSHIASSCGKNCESRNVSEIQITNTIDDFAPTPCPAGTVEIWWDMPEYDEEGLFVIGSIPTRTCVPEDATPAG